ncbi:serine protease family S33, partial [Thraustotheca clavata]
MAEIFQATGGLMNIYTMDHRGVGRSSRLDTFCPLNSTPKTLEGVAPYYEQCFEAIKVEYGDDAPKAFSVTSAASDIALIIQNQTQENAFVYGVSYGTYLVERLMHLAPSNVKGYILDSIVSENPVKYWSDWDLDVASTESYYYSVCDHDDFCASKLGNDSKQVAINVLKKLDLNNTECAQTIYAAKGLPSYFLGQLFSGLVQVYNQRNMIPAILYRLQRCVVSIESEITFLDHLIGKKIDGTNDGGVHNDVLPGDPYNPKSTVDRMVYYNIVYNELWRPITAEEWINQTHQLTWQSENSQTIAVKLEIYNAFQAKFSYQHDMYWNKTASVPQNSSVLMLSSSIDPQTNLKYAVYENASMLESNKLLVQFPFGSHFAYASTNMNLKNPSENCAAAIVHSYLKAN